MLSFAAGLLHPGAEDPNDHPAAFAEYAASGNWTAVHLGQFAGMAVLISGLMVLFVALNLRTGGAGAMALLGFLSAVAAFVLYAVLQAVDGVALKQAVDAWAASSEPDKAARLAGAETVRWIEWGVRSYQSFLLGASFVLLGATGTSGFAPANALPTLAGIVLTAAWTVYLLVIVLRLKEPKTPKAAVAAD